MEPAGTCKPSPKNVHLALAHYGARIDLLQDLPPSPGPWSSPSSEPVLPLGILGTNVLPVAVWLFFLRHLQTDRVCFTAFLKNTTMFFTQEMLVGERHRLVPSRR